VIYLAFDRIAARLRGPAASGAAAGLRPGAGRGADAGEPLADSPT